MYTGCNPLMRNKRVLRPALVGVWLFLFGCTTEDIVAPFDCETSDLRAEVAEIVAASGCNASDAKLTIAARGGEPPYRFTVNDEAWQAEGTFTALPPGIYTVRVTDDRNCTDAIDNVHIGAQQFAVVVDVQPDHLCLGGDGTVTIAVDGGAPPFAYQLEDHSFTDSPFFSGLNKGNHSITVRDAENCVVQLNVTIPHGQTQTSWKKDILPIMETTCAIKNCHDGVFQPDLRLYDKASFYAAAMKRLTQDGSMPQEGKLPQDKIDLIACWVDDGAPDN